MTVCVVIPCSSIKNYDRMCAQDMYGGSTFEMMKQWAKSRHVPWFIASAKYGLLLPDTVIDNYSLILERHKGPSYRGVEVADVAQRAVLRASFWGGLGMYDRRVYLCGAAYLKLMPPGETPLAGLRGFGPIRHWLKTELEK
jgi:hypothetical protein